MIITFPLTVSTLVVPCVNELAVPLAVKVKFVHELLLFIVVTAPAAIVMGPNVVLAVPLIVFVPENVTPYEPALSVPPLFVQLPATAIFPAKVCVPAVNVIFPNVMAAVGVMEAEAVKFASTRRIECQSSRRYR